ncbi:hypothetical protein BDZ94DRAFT_473001 [Collybia nuda]|uniref:Uncharacterized protein n=1 Tax=Collybia nuda TaxID=64659 RepID=A0A9P5Y995_9AGAR|nr:hypothetical protein BDZ94DRAFT_473001 [Collybia nuda]
MKSIILYLISGAAAVLASTLNIIEPFGECGGDIKGVCALETQCTGGTPSFCIPSKFFSNSSIKYKEVTGYGEPTASLVPTKANVDIGPVFVACTDHNFLGICSTLAVGCGICYGLDSVFTHSISSISMITTSIGCNFWVNSNCIGDGINIDSGAIYDLAATNYNDRTVAFSCYFTGR